MLSFILKVNGKDEAVRMENGYMIINREWKKGDIVECMSYQ